MLRKEKRACVRVLNSLRCHRRGHIMRVQLALNLEPEEKRSGWFDPAFKVARNGDRSPPFVDYTSPHLPRTFRTHDTAADGASLGGPRMDGRTDGLPAFVASPSFVVREAGGRMGGRAARQVGRPAERGSGEVDG